MIYYLDNHWQKPAQTEMQAFEDLKSAYFISSSANNIYIGFPWANLIDGLCFGWKNVGLYLNALKQISNMIEGTHNKKSVFTTCQHVWAFRKEFYKYFELLKIDKIFWSHAPSNRLNLNASPKHPFYNEKDVQIFLDKFNVSTHPLFSVQCNNTITEDEFFNPLKKHLASFTGMIANDFMLNDDRIKIHEAYSSEDSFFIRDSGKWFYENNVYGNQTKTPRNDFLDILKNSFFSLCPSGTGPNSIRLWESINAGSIPVFFSSRPELVEIDSCDWRDCTISIEDYQSIENLPRFLKGISVKDIKRKQEALFQVSSELTSRPNNHLIKYYYSNE